MTAQTVSTQRLLLRRWQARDRAPFAAMYADPEVMRFIGSDNIMTEGQVAADIATYETFWDENGFGQFAVELRQTGQLIGFVGLAEHTLLPEYASFTEIGWRFARHVWGKGYAKEAAKAAMDFGVNNCGLSDIVSVCHIENIASERIMQTIGLKLDRTSVAPNNGRSIKIYTLQKP